MANIAHEAASNPLNKHGSRSIGAWLNNYSSMSWTLTAPALGLCGALLVLMFSRAKMLIVKKFVFVASSISLFGIISTVGVSMFPFILPSSSDPTVSLIVWDASSSHTTLFVMLIATGFFLPIILAYTAWVYRVMRGPVSENDIASDDSKTMY